MNKRDKVKVLFVCLGNICRSPLGEGVFRHVVNEAGLSDFFYIDSAGTSGYNTGSCPDPLARKAAKSHGIFIDDLRARKLDKTDLGNFDYIIAMDKSNLKNIEKVGEAKGRLHLMREFDPEGSGEVPDPYCMGEEAFNEVYDMIERSCINLVDVIIREHSLKVMEA